MGESLKALSNSNAPLPKMQGSMHHPSDLHPCYGEPLEAANSATELLPVIGLDGSRGGNATRGVSTADARRKPSQHNPDERKKIKASVGVRYCTGRILVDLQSADHRNTS